jgi:hypothetical protein
MIGILLLDIEVFFFCGPALALCFFQRLFDSSVQFQDVEMSGQISVVGQLSRRIVYCTDLFGGGPLSFKLNFILQ